MRTDPPGIGTRSRGPGVSILLLPVLAAIVGLSAPARADGSMPSGDLSNDPEARGFAEMLFGQCRLSLEDGDLPRALGECDRAAATWPQDATYIYYSGLVLLRMNDDSRAEEAAQRLTRALPPAGSRVAEWKIRSDLGLALYRAGLPAKAEAELARALAINPSDAPTRFTRGLALLDLDRAADAEAEFAAASKADPSLAGDAHYYRGVALLRSGNEPAAREELRQASSAGGTDASLANEAREFLDVGAGVLAGESAARPSPLGLRVTVAFENDSNPALYNDILATAYAPVQEGSDGDLRAVVALRGDWHPFFDRHGVSGSARIEAYGAFYRDYDVADQVTPGATFALTFGGTPIGFLNGPLGYDRVPVRRSPLAGILQAGTSYTWVDGESFLRVTTLAGGMQRDWAGWTSTELTLASGWNDWLGEFSERSYRSTTGQLAEYFRFRRPDRYLRVGYVYADLDTDGTTAFDVQTGLTVESDDYFDSVDKGWIADLSLPVSRSWSLFGAVSRRKEDFAEDFPVSFGILLPRRDKQVDYSLAAIVALNDWWYLTGRYAHTKQDSEIPEFSYRRDVWSFASTWHW